MTRQLTFLFKEFSTFFSCFRNTEYLGLRKAFDFQSRPGQNLNEIISYHQLPMIQLAFLKLKVVLIFLDKLKLIQIMRSRSASHNSSEKISPRRQDIKSQHFQIRKVPLHQENGMLKDKLHQMKFEVEDNLQTVIDGLDKDLQLKAKLINFQQLFGLIKEQINKNHEKIENQSEQIERLQNNLEITISQREEDFLNYSQMNRILTEQLQQSKQQLQTLKAKSEEQIKILTHQNYQQETELHQMKKELHQEFQLTHELQNKISKVSELESQLKEQQVSQANIVAQLNQQIEKNNQVFKNELEIQQQKIVQKYRQMISDNKSMIEQIQELKQNFNQMKQQKDSMEKTFDSNNSKVKELKSEMISDKQQISKSEKIIAELQKDLSFYKNKAQIDEKKEIKLKEQLQQYDEQIQELLQFKVNYTNLKKILMIEHQADIEKIKQLHQLDIQHQIEQQTIQRLKYETLLGNNVDDKEREQFQMIDFSSQYEDPSQKKYINDLYEAINEQNKLMQMLKNDMKNTVQAHLTEKDGLIQKFEQEKNQLIALQKQELQLQLSEFEEFKAKLQSDFNFKTQLLSSQFSFQLDQAKLEQKQLQQIIDQSKLSGDEQTKLLEYASEEIMRQRKKYDHDMYEEKNTQKQLKHEYEGQVLQLKQENQRLSESTKKEIEHLKQQLKELLHKEQSLKQQVNELTNEQKLDKANIALLESQTKKKSTENSRLNEIIKGLNTRVRTLQLEVENTKQNYNIFSPPATSLSHHFLRKTELEIKTEPVQRHSVTDVKLELKFKPEIVEGGKKSARNKSQQGQRHYVLKQQLMPYI